LTANFAKPDYRIRLFSKAETSLEFWISDSKIVSRLAIVYVLSYHQRMLKDQLEKNPKSKI